MLSAKLSVETLKKVLDEHYRLVVCPMRENGKCLDTVPALDFLARSGYSFETDTSLCPACTAQAAPSEQSEPCRCLLDDLLVQYQEKLKSGCSVVFPSIDDVAFDMASSNVGRDVRRYREKVISKGIEYALDNSFYNLIATEIERCFDVFDHDTFWRDEESTIAVLDCALRDGFFDDFFDYVSNLNGFSLGNSEEMFDEIGCYCLSRMQTLKACEEWF